MLQKHVLIKKIQNVRMYYMCIMCILYALRMYIAYAFYICALLCYDENMF